MRPAIEVWRDAFEIYWLFAPFAVTTKTDAADRANAAAVIEADRAALVAEIVAWLPKQLPHLSSQEYADAIAAKWGARP